jgi:hypothetical protein
VSGLVSAVFVLQNFFKDGCNATQHELKKRGEYVEKLPIKHSSGKLFYRSSGLILSVCQRNISFT